MHSNDLLWSSTHRSLVTPQAPPKHFTDEELKQQYGIHLATRLQADADGKEAKWADIDDDEDDWAPETIEWNDGTKITLPQNDIVADITEKQSASQTEKDSRDSEIPQTNGTSKSINMVGPNATVLRLGNKVLPKSTGVVLKTPSDKPTLVAKPAAPPPARSPWASLPPVDKMTPVSINPPMQTTQIHYQRRESMSKAAESPASTPAMEIAADSFSRTSRDSGGPAQGQLYNSQSGQYETVSSNRRGSTKRDQNFRPPALLQRPSPTDKSAPNIAKSEISLLSRRTSIGGTESQFRTRRESSIKEDGHIDGIATEGASEMNLPGAFSSRTDTAPAAPQAAITSSPGSIRPYTFRKPGSIVEGTTFVNSPGAATITMSPMTDEVNAQRQLMQESIEKARQRKQEELQREEEARQERIRKKLEALGPLTHKQPERGRGLETSGKAPAVTSQSEVAPEKVQKTSSDDLALQGKDSSKHIDTHYALGSMQKPVTVNGNTVAGDVKGTTPQSLKSPTFPPNIDRGKETQGRPVINGDQGPKVDQSSTSGVQDNASKTAVLANNQQTWNLEGGSYGGWKNTNLNSQTSPIGNLWGPPAHHKAIGNGTFDQNIPRQPLRSSPFEELQSTPVLQPIGPPKAVQTGIDLDERSRHLLQPRESLPSYPAPPMSRSPSSQLQKEEKGKSSQGIPYGAHLSQPLSSGDIPRGNRSHEFGLDAWSNFKATAQITEREQAKQASQEFLALSADEQRKRLQGPEVSEVWRQVQISGDSNQRRLVNVRKEEESPDGMANLKRPDVSPYKMLPQVAPPSNPSRQSRFMPFMGTSYQMPIQQMGVRSIDAPRSPSPPPPETSVHPAFDRSHGLPKPVVNLPGTTTRESSTNAQGLDTSEFSLDSPTEKPKVRLPPAPVALPGVAADLMPSSNFADIRGAPLRAVSQPLVNNRAWQDRFNGLLGTTTKRMSPEKATATRVSVPAPPAVDSTSKDPLELVLPQVPATISLPAKDDDSNSTGLPVASYTIATEDEEALFENREFGSLPTVKLTPVDTTWKQAKSSKGRKYNKTPAKEVFPASKDIVDYPLTTVPGGILIFINFKGMITPKSKVLRHQNRQNGQPADPHQRKFSAGGNVFRGRESTASFQQRSLQTQIQPSMQHPEIPPYNANTNSRGFFNKRHGHAQAHGHTHSPWNGPRRVASMAH